MHNIYFFTLINNENRFNIFNWLYFLDNIVLVKVVVMMMNLHKDEI